MFNMYYLICNYYICTIASTIDLGAVTLLHRRNPQKRTPVSLAYRDGMGLYWVPMARRSES